MIGTAEKRYRRLYAWLAPETVLNSCDEPNGPQPGLGLGLLVIVAGAWTDGPVDDRLT